MKAHDITEPGFYWALSGAGWTIIKAEYRMHWPDRPGAPAEDPRILDFWIIGRDDEFLAREINDEIIGPITPPAT